MDSFVGKLIVISGLTYRINAQDETNCVLYEWNSTKFEPVIISSDSLRTKMSDGSACYAEDQCQIFTDENELKERLPGEVLEEYETRKAFMRKVMEKAGFGMMNLAGRSPKPWFESLYKEFGYTKCKARRIVLRCAYSSPWESGLVDKRFFVKGKEAVGYSSFAGRRFENGTCPYRIEEDDIEHMEEAVNLLKEGKHRSITVVYRWLIDTYYSETLPMPAGVRALDDSMRRILPKGQRISERQFRLYLSSKKEEIKEAHLGMEAYRNDCRRLYGRPSEGLPYPGYLVEVDALDMDLNIVSAYNREKAASRPTIYVMRDVLTGMILAAAVTLEKNSVAGVARLIMNMLTDHVEFAARFGIELEPDLWPSFIIPSAWRTDHGSDFMSKDLEAALVNANVRKESAPPRTGSYKGKIEGLFNVFYKETKPFLEGHGLVSKEYKGNDVKGAHLTIEDMWAIVILFVKWFNGHVYTSKERKIDPKMMKDPEASNTSRFLWNWGVKHQGSPRIADEATRIQMLFNLMEKVSASINKDGIHCCGLIYDEPEDDRDMTDRIIAAKRTSGKRDSKGEKLNDVSIRRDPATVEYLYYIKNGRIMRCTLNTTLSRDMRINSLSGELRFMTWDEYEDFRAAEKVMKANDEEKLLEGSIAYGKSVTKVVCSSESKIPASSRNMRENHLEERQEDNSRNSLTRALEAPDSNQEEETTPPETPEGYEVVDTPAEDEQEEEFEFLDPVAEMIRRANTDYKG